MSVFLDDPSLVLLSISLLFGLPLSDRYVLPSARPFFLLFPSANLGFLSFPCHFLAFLVHNRLVFVNPIVEYVQIEEYPA